MSNQYKIILIAVVLVFSSCKDENVNTPTTVDNTKQFVIDSANISVDTTRIKFRFNYHYRNTIGNWIYFYLWTSKSISTGPAMIKLFSESEPYINDASRIFQDYKNATNNKPNEFIWIYYGFRGDFYDSTAKGLQVSGTFNVRDSILVKVQN